MPVLYPPSSFSIIFSHSFSITYERNGNIFRVILVNVKCIKIYLRPYSLTKNKYHERNLQQRSKNKIYNKPQKRGQVLF